MLKVRKVAFASIATADQNARNLLVVEFVNTVNRNNHVSIVMDRAYVKQTGHRIIQDVEQQETEDWINSETAAL